VTITPGTTGKPLVIFFYPSAGTAVCTKEACGFRDSLSSKDVYKNANLEIVGISADSVTKNKGWAEQHNLNFTLLSDVDRKVRKEYQTSSALFGLVDGRYTFCVDSEGYVRGVESSTLSASAHHALVDSWVAGLSGNS